MDAVADFTLTLYIGGRRDEFRAYCAERGLRCTGPWVDAVHVAAVQHPHAFSGIHAPRLRVVYAEEPTEAIREALAPLINVMREGAVEEIHLGR